MRIFRFPLAKITLFFIIGLVVANFYAISPEALVCCGLAIIVILLTLSRIGSPKFDKSVIYGTAVSMLCVTIGMLNYELHRSINNTNHFINSDAVFESQHNVELTLREQLKATQKNFRFIADVSYIDGNNVVGRILLNIKRDSTPVYYSIGQIIQLRSNIVKNSPPLNPDQFDYGKYLSNKEIHGQIFAKKDQFLLKSKTKTAWYYTNKIRSKIISNLKKSDLNQRELAVLSALLLGQRQEIDPSIIRDYQYAGAVHILSVSGLHVGLIIVFINAFLKFLPSTKTTKFFKLVIILGSLWIFAVVASLSPSVVRAVTMFSFIAIGMSLNRSTNIFHTLIVSLLLILLIQPSFIFDVGFQLSYVALFSILWLQPTFASLWQPENLILKYFWDILTVSFAAQIGALPISLYYFHQFPGLFFITNIVVIPILTIIMILGIIAMIIAIFSTVPVVIIILLEVLLRGMNYSIHFIASFEKFVIGNVPMDGIMLATIYLALVSFFIYVKKPVFRNCIVSLLAIVVCIITNFNNEYNANVHEKFLVFHQRSNSIILHTNRDTVHICTSKNLSEWDTKSIQSYATANYLSIGAQLPLSNYHFFKDKKITIIDSSGVWDANAKPNIVLLVQSPKINLERLISTISPEEIIVDGTNYAYLTKKWKATCKKAKIPFHDTREKGSYILQ